VIQDTYGRTALHQEVAENPWGSFLQSRKKGHDEVVAMLKEHTACGGRK
jgi:hypothetical protein